MAAGLLAVLGPIPGWAAGISADFVPGSYPTRALVTRDGVLVRAKPAPTATVVTVVHRDLLVEVVKRTAGEQTVGGARRPWYFVRMLEREGWVFGSFLTFEVPDNLPDTYAPRQPMDWFFKKFGEGTGYAVADFDKVPVSVEEFRQLIAEAEGGDAPAGHVLARSLYRALGERSTDPALEYWKPRLFGEPLVLKLLSTVMDGYYPRPGPRELIVKALPPAWWTASRTGEVLAICRVGALEWLPSAVWSDAEVATRIAPRADLIGSAYTRFTEQIRADPVVARAAVGASGYNYRLLPRQLKSDRSLALLAFRTYHAGTVFSDMPDAFRQDREICTLAVWQNGDNWKLVSPALRQDRKFALAAVQSQDEGPRAFGNMAGRWRLDPDISLAAVRASGLSYPLLPAILQANTMYIEAALAAPNGEEIYPAIPARLKHRREFALRAVALRGGNIREVPATLRRDPEILEAWLKSENWASGLFDQPLPADLAGNREVAERCVSKSGSSLRAFDEGLRNDPVLFQAAVEQSPCAYACAGPALLGTAEYEEAKKKCNEGEGE